jgi:hypothetical protein
MCAELPNFLKRSLPCNDGSGRRDYKFCSNWCNPGRHHCSRCECQTCDFCLEEDDRIAWRPYPPPSPRALSAGT